MLEGRNLGLQFLNRSRSGGLVKNLFFGGGNFIIRRFLQVIDIFLVERWTLLGECLRDRAALEQFEFALAFLQPLATAAE